MADAKKTVKVLGLDLGANSVGWVLVEREGGEDKRIAAAGVRVFDAAVDGQFETGRTKSRAVARRQARQQRRMTERRARRMTRLFRLLQRNGLMPHGDPATVLPELDRALLAAQSGDPGMSAEEQARLPHTLPYRLRALALDGPLAPYELGRALYHLGQRRGFLSNRKAAVRDEKEESTVKEGIAQLDADMQATGARTLGEYFARLDPRDPGCRIRKRWTARTMYEHEFDGIWSAQAAHHPDLLTEEAHDAIRHAIFHQRPLKSAKGLIGTCELEHGRRRAPKALLVAQRFRVVQQLNNVKIIAPDGFETPLTPAQRAALLERLNTEGDLPFPGARRLLKPPRGSRFTLEEGGEKKFTGNRTAAKLRAIFGAPWDGLDAREQDRIVDDIRSMNNDDALERRGREEWGLDAQAAKQFAKVTFDDGYCSLSRRAIGKLLPLMEKGMAYSTAVKEVYGEFRPGTQPLDALPAVLSAMPHLRNPVVFRVLTELRKVVNGVIRVHGKPDFVRIELARDMRKTAKQRQQTWQRNRRNEDARSAAKRRILNEAGLAEPSRRDIEKVLLLEECGGFCPYTGKAISMASILGPNPQFDIEHIIPFSRSLDDSFLNKTLCYMEENRNRKRNRTPFEAYGQDPQWDEIIQRVERFQGNARAEKLRRFRLEDVKGEDGFLDDFADSQLNDTRHASREAQRYVALLYGGYWDEGGRRRVQAARGGVTAFLRDVWGLNAILGDGGAKSRDDHRHHAVDALAVALTTPATMKRLSDAAQRAPAEGRRRFGEMPEPWPGFIVEAKQRIREIVVSHRTARALNVKLHKDTIYSPSFKDRNGVEWVHLRKPLAGIKSGDIEAIVDPAVRRLVREKLDALGGNTKAFETPENHPCLTTRDGRLIPIHSVRIQCKVSTFPVGERERRRNVASETNHHMEIIEETGPKGPRWRGRLVSAYEARCRQHRGEPVIQRDHGDGKRFLFSLASGDLIEIDGENGSREICVVRTITQSQSHQEVAFCQVFDARPKKDIIAAKDWDRCPPNRLRTRNCRKIIVTPLGEVRYAND